MDACQQAALAPLLPGGIRREPTAHRKTFGLERGQRHAQPKHRQTQGLSKLRGRHRPQPLEAPSNDGHQRLVRGRRLRFEQIALVGIDPERPMSRRLNAHYPSLCSELPDQARPRLILAHLVAAQECQP